VSAAFEAAELAEAEIRYRNQLGREMYELGLARGRAEHVAAADAARAVLREPPDPEVIDTISKAAARAHAAIEETRWGPGGRAHFADPRPGDFPGRRARQPEAEPELEIA
jgi:hypothetical protein